MKKRSRGKSRRKSKGVFRLMPDPVKVLKSIERLGLNQEDMRVLEAYLRPVPGAPLVLGLPHYLFLNRVRETAERFWYQEKAEKEALTARELEREIRENLFYQILKRKAPKPPAIGKRRPPPKTDPEAFDKDPAYQKLVRDIQKIFEKAEAKGVDIRHHRNELLECRKCGAFEDVFCGEEIRRTFLESGEETSKTFLVVDRKDSTGYYAYASRCGMKYQYICGVCGAHQKASFAEVFYNDVFEEESSQ